MTVACKLGPYVHRWKRQIRILAIVITVIILCSVMLQTIHDMETYPGIDLRSKVVGARLLVRGMNPYYDFRVEPHPDHLRMLNDDTYSPALLLLYAPLCEMNWDIQRRIYFAIDWVSILLCFALLLPIFPNKVSRTALWAAYVLLFIAGFGFRFHLERGQYYIELALLEVITAVCLLRKTESWIYSLPLSLLVLIRPSYAICIVGAFLLRKFRIAAYAVCLCVLLFAATLPLAGIHDWKNYVAVIRSNEREALDAAYGRAPRKVLVDPGRVVEGRDFSKSLTGPGYLADRTLIGIARSSVSPALARLIHDIASTEERLKYLNAAGLLLALGFDLAVMYGLSLRPLYSLVAIAFVFLAPLNLELFAPQHYGYCDVAILAPLMIILAAILERSARRGWALYMLIMVSCFALPWLAFRLNDHVPLVSFLQYVAVLAILNLVCVVEVCQAHHLSRREAYSNNLIDIGTS